MKYLVTFFIHAYWRTLDLYPRRFKDKFASEMNVVFRESVMESAEEGIESLILLCSREFIGMPLNILKEFWHDFQREEAARVTNEILESQPKPDEKTGHWDALVGALPFALFGIASMLSRTQYPFNGAYSYLTFYAAVLFGLLLGMIKGFPRWAYSYLGWCVVFAWWWTNMYTNGLRIFGYTMGNEGWGWRIWYPLLITIAIAILWARSFRPIRQMVFGIWQDWKLLSLAIYAFVTFASLIYDENHHPYLFAFIAATTIVVCLAVWGFLKSDSSWKLVVLLLAAFVTAFVLSNISYATQNYAGYYNLPPSTPQPWYTAAFDGIIGWTLLYSGIMYWPVVIGLVRHVINNRQKPVRPA
jgi:hypothetical protein